MKRREELSTIYTGGKRIVVYNNGDVEEENLVKPEPTEPIFDDEKVSKAIRAWLSIQVQPIVAVAILCTKDNDGFFCYRLYGYIDKARIVDDKAVVNKNLTAIDFEFRSDVYFEHKRGCDYAIKELLGEEK